MGEFDGNDPIVAILISWFNYRDPNEPRGRLVLSGSSVGISGRNESKRVVGINWSAWKDPSESVLPARALFSSPAGQGLHARTKPGCIASRPRPLLRGVRDPVLPAPGEPEQKEILVRAFLFDAFEHFAKLAVCQKEAQPLALIAVAVVVQDLFDVHGIPLVVGIVHIRIYNDRRSTGRYSGDSCLPDASSGPLRSLPQLSSVEEAPQ